MKASIKSYAATISLLLMSNSANALDPMYDYRYNLGTEILVPDAFFGSAGFYTRLNEDGAAVINLQLGLSDWLEVGMKSIFGTNDSWIILPNNMGYPDRSRKFIPIVDFGMKFALNSHLALQADVPFALNTNRDWGAVFSITQWQGYTKNIFFFYEGRLGVGSAAGKGGIVKPSVSFVPAFQIGNGLRVFIASVASTSWENYKEDAMFDIMPRFEAGFVWFRIIGEVSAGIVPEKNKYNRWALFLSKDL